MKDLDVLIQMVRGSIYWKDGEIAINSVLTEALLDALMAAKQIENELDNLKV